MSEEEETGLRMLTLQKGNWDKSKDYSTKDLQGAQNHSRISGVKPVFSFQNGF